MKTKIAFLCALALALTAAPAFAQCGRGVIIRGNPVCHTPVVVHHSPVVVTPVAEIITPIAIPVAIPVIVPAFTYQYVPPVQVAPGVPVYPGAPAPGYGQPYPVQPGYAPPVQYNGPYQTPLAAPQPGLPGVDNSNARLKELAKLLLEEMRRQDAADNGGPGGQDTGPPMAIYPNAQPQAAPPVLNLGGRPNPQSPFAQPAINALAKNCMSCHTGPGSKSEVVIFSQLNQLNPEAPFKTMLKEVQQGRMPPRQSNWALTQQEFQAITAWLEGR